MIAQRDIPFSNSKIEAFNKIIKHQFLLPQNLENRKKLINTLAEDVPAYNTVRPQYSLHGNTPEETFGGKPIAVNSYKNHFAEQKTQRIILINKINVKLTIIKIKKAFHLVLFIERLLRFKLFHNPLVFRKIPY